MLGVGHEVKFDEKSTKFFFDKLRRLEDKKYIKAILTADGTELMDINDVKDEIQAFYAKLYMAHDPDDSTLTDVLNVIDPVLTEEDNQSFLRLITVDEVRAAVKHMKDNKSPGDDGLPCEFYKALGDDVFFELREIYNACLINGTMPRSFKNAVVTILYKKHDPRLIKKLVTNQFVKC